ncbi:MAG: glycerophosphodiester phosphodiesterase family protein [Actinomycetota bacterium]
MPSQQARPEVVAHRGSSTEQPEHTLSAYLRAIDLGADALECDVRLTADNHLVCVHDRRVNRTSNGRGPVSSLELAELEQLDWASWSTRPGDPEQPDRDDGRLLTLRRLLDAVRDADRPVTLAIETKHPTRYAGQVERALAAVLDDYGWAGVRRGITPPVRVMSFSPLALSRMRQLTPQVPLVLLIENRMRRVYRDSTLPRGVSAVGLAIETVRKHPRYVDRVRAAGRQVHVWTVDRTADVELCVDLGVDAIITNRPRHVLGLLGRGPEPLVSTSTAR